jgi:hypothetical protein
MVAGPGNILRIGAVVAITLLDIGIMLFIDYGGGLADAANSIRMKRRCRDCGGTFIRDKKPSDQPICGQCGYDLTGNVSGVCPECGWKLPRRIKTRARQTG